MGRRVGRREFVNRSAAAIVAASLVPAEAASALSAAERQTLRAAMDAIIPAARRMPAASEVNGVPYVAGLASADPAFAALLAQGLRELDARARERTGRRFAAADLAGRTAALAHAESTDSPRGFFVALRDAVYEAYYSNPAVWKLVGYRFRSGPRRTAALEPFDAARLARVRGMGRLYREAD